MRKCNTCKQEKELDEFKRLTRLCRSTHCNSCQADKKQAKADSVKAVCLLGKHVSGKKIGAEGNANGWCMGDNLLITGSGTTVKVKDLVLIEKPLMPTYNAKYTAAELGVRL